MAKLYRASARQTATVWLLIVFVGINLFGYLGYQNSKCVASRDYLQLVEYLTISAAVLAVYALVSLIVRAFTKRPLPMEMVAAVLSVLISGAWVIIHLMACERII